MMRFRRTKTMIGAAAMVATYPAIARADWQGTLWGMSRAETIKSIPFSTQPEPAPNPKHTSPDLIGTYATGRFIFTAKLSYEARGRLIDIELRLKNPGDCLDLRSALFAKYGTKDSELPPSSGSDAYSWTDAAARNTVTMVTINDKLSSPTFCAIEYSPLAKDQADGL